MNEYAPYYHIPKFGETCSVPRCGKQAVLGYYDEFCEIVVCTEHDDSGESIFVWLEADPVKQSNRKITLKTPNSKRPFKENEAVISFSTHLKEKTEPQWVDPDTFESFEIALHKDCSNHYDKIIEYNCASCFYCLKTFTPENIQEWADEVRWTDKGQTAICPNCRIDAILPGVVSNDILVLMHHHWFCTATNLTTGEEISVCDCEFNE